MWKKFLIFLTLITLISIYYFSKIKKTQISSPAPPQASSTALLDSQPSPLPTSPSLPKSYLIKTTFVPQAPEKNWDQPWQDACEEAALLTAIYYLKDQSPAVSQIKNDILALIDYQTQMGWPKDINLSQMSQIANDYFQINSKIIINPTIEEIKYYISQNKPVLVPANGKVLFRENKYFKDEGPYYHNITILGYNDAKKQFTVHDVGTQHGAYFTYSYQTLMESIHDLPSSGDKYDINLGQPAILVFGGV